MTALSVNLNKIALIRNARPGNEPDILHFGNTALTYGATGLTVHPRPDQRHIRFSDLQPLAALVNQHPNKEFNIEGYPSPDFIKLVCAVKPHQVTFVPDPPEALTSSFGWDINKHASFLTDIVAQCQAHNIRTSLFIDYNCQAINQLTQIKTNRVEFYTGPYAANYPHQSKPYLTTMRDLAQSLQSVGVGINAGHDLNLTNLNQLINTVPNILEVSIGHALTCEALIQGWEPTIKRYISILQQP